jgi:hypothetical protein
MQELNIGVGNTNRRRIGLFQILDPMDVALFGCNAIKIGRLSESYFGRVM